MKNNFVHMELQTTNVSGAKDFYGSLLNWDTDDIIMGDMPYTKINNSDGPGGGIMKNPDPNGSPHWVVFVGVEDVEMSGKEAEKLGGKILQPKTQVPNMGCFIIVSDPQGAVLGLWQAG